jgi:hypothetical protein
MEMKTDIEIEEDMKTKERKCNDIIYSSENKKNRITKNQ